MAGVVVLLIGFVVVGASFLVVSTDADRMTKYSEKCSGSNSTARQHDPALDKWCNDEEAYVTQVGAEMLAMWCGGGLMVIIGIILIIWGAVKKEAPPVGQYPSQYPPQYPQQYPSQYPPQGPQQWGPPPPQYPYQGGNNYNRPPY